MPSVSDSAPTTHRCTRCGTDFPVDVLGCPACGRVAGTHSARITLIVTLILIFAGTAFTQYFVNLHRNTQFSLANRWFLRGGEAMQAHLPDVAANDYRTALSYDPDNEEYRLRLAQALLAGNRLNEARAHLLSLWEEEPANGEVNLTLARLYAKRGDLNNAVRYYNNATGGVWPDDPRRQRVVVRFELSNYLMEHNQTTEAQSELMALLADGPRQPADQLHLGQLLLQVNEPEHTLELDNTILSKDHNNAQAWLQKAHALLALNRYVEAEHALANAVERNAKDDAARQQLDVLREALRLDTSLRGLSRTDRAQRAIESFHQAWTRLADCAKQQGVSLTPAVNTGTAPSPSAAAPPNALQLLYNSGLQKQATVTLPNLREDPDALDATMQYAFEVERSTTGCANANRSDEALLLLARREGTK